VNPNIISASDVVFDYATKRALFGVSIEVPRGATLAVVGPNGAGKSTLMRVLAGLDAPLAGGVVVDGVDVLASPRLAHTKLGYLADFFGLYDELTVAQCLRHAATIRGVPNAAVDAAITRSAARLGLTERLNETAGQLSRGLKQRLAIAQALIHQPKVLLLDEPAAGLDPEARASLSGLFRQLRADGMTLVVSSHILAELEEYSTHMLAIRDGRVAEFTRVADWASGVSAESDVSATLRYRLTWINTGAPDFLSTMALLPAEVRATAQTVALDDAAQSATLDILGGSAAAAAMLSALIVRGAQISEFSPVRVSLQESYLKSVNAVRMQSEPTNNQGAAV
jgi:ABC-2 type transport system ATP-binding protein